MEWGSKRKSDTFVFLCEQLDESCNLFFFLSSSNSRRKRAEEKNNQDLQFRPGTLEMLRNHSSVGSVKIADCLVGRGEVLTRGKHWRAHGCYSMPLN